MQKTIKIDIVSDLVCPWCYIGQKRLSDAIKQSEYKFEISWKAFQLHPELGKDGMAKDEFLQNKFGPEGEGMFDKLKDIAVSESLDMNPELITNIPNTIDVHRLMILAKKHQKDHELATLLFKAYFVDGKDFSKTDTLVEVGKSCGLSKTEILTFLKSDEGRKEVLMEEEMYRESGINAVPSFIINNKYMIEGAQSADVFLEAFKQLEQ
ncbi:DsbA family oxidoreductase [Daejeonella oryzae]|uniref:DsbA family oxidoreductase n=1 Tax=Daejeonella oryzae TaxID=1122943 RepID=UPI000428020A|nr:DsbA family oxidoreductase [Daejeonella oryzae]